jgi:hypothetical protein
LPVCDPAQSPGHDRQLSPTVGSHTPLPQKTPALDTQSLPQVVQTSSVSHLPSWSHTGQPPQLE